ncbi:hypothetical protein J6590_094212, partial [Homalodisca vitripennis]
SETLESPLMIEGPPMNKRGPELQPQDGLLKYFVWRQISVRQFHLKGEGRITYNDARNHVVERLNRGSYNLNRFSNIFYQEHCQQQPSRDEHGKPPLH